jgi:hypothetical protein
VFSYRFLFYFPKIFLTIFQKQNILLRVRKILEVIQVEDLRSRFQSLVEIHGHRWTVISEILTREKYKTPTGLLKWSKNCARKYFNRILREDQSPYKSDDIFPGVGASRSVTGYLNWWNRTQKPSKNEIERRPILTGTKQKIGPRVSVDLLKQVKACMKRDGLLMEVTLSHLIEFLLFRYVGSPETLVKREEIPVETRETNQVP